MAKDTPEVETPLTLQEKVVKELREWGVTLSIFIPIFLIFSGLFYELRVIPSESMVPNLQVGDRVALGVFSAWDFEESRAQDQRFFIQRVGVDWVFEFEFDIDITGGVGFGFSFSPRALFDPRLRARSLRDEPQFSNFSDTRIR